MNAVTEKQTTTAQAQNGVNVPALLGIRDAFSKAPQAAQFRWRARSKWMGGTHTRTGMKGYFGVGQEQSHKTEFTIETDHPELFAAEDHAATPVEVVLSALAGCLTAGVASVAQMRNIQLRSVTATLEGGMDLHGILGMDADVRNGFDGIQVKFDIDADATREEIEALIAQSQKRSAVYDILTNPTNVTVTLG